MAWYDEAVFYHIYPLGMTGAPKQNAYDKPVHRLNTLTPWISHIAQIGCNAIYIGPLFESVGHGYETTERKEKWNVNIVEIRFQRNWQFANSAERLFLNS